MVEEQSCHDRSSTRMAYLNAVIRVLSVFKRDKLDFNSNGAQIKDTTLSLPKSGQTELDSSAPCLVANNTDDISDPLAPKPTAYFGVGPDTNKEDQLLEGFVYGKPNLPWAL
ncbi:unnamed protein product [Protopolystoma xenopodis]|uniref:Uncharacterized protein n=1 Tax=Protopolystoma xenopodis TaxID=117903 RepID=A0A448WX12_9PLAT|nr:unnamed protein product [Protopolystoma xenopodis]